MIQIISQHDVVEQAARIKKGEWKETLLVSDARFGKQLVNALVMAGRAFKIESKGFGVHTIALVGRPKRGTAETR